MIVITGASNGLGKELTKLYLSEAKRVVGLSRTQPENGVEFVQTDFNDEDSINQAARKINSDPDKLEALVNCAGVYSEQDISKLTASEIQRIFQTNVQAPMLLVSLLMDRIKKDGADIVNVASTVGLKAYESQAAYGSSKWALRGFSANLQLELKKTPCRVVSFCPGGFISNLVKNFNGQEIPDPQNWMSTQDVAKALKQTLDLPKNMEVSEIIINRK
jgi:short-subunit dehydrogenase